MAKNRLIGNTVNLILIIIMSFFCISLMSSGKQLSENLKTSKEVNTLETESIVVKYHLVNNGDTIIVDRKLDSLVKIAKN